MNAKGKNIIVTGGASGIGKAIVSNLVSKGANVIVIDLNIDDCKVDCWRCDLIDRESLSLCLRYILEKHGHIDVLVNNAGIVMDSPLIGIGNKRHSLSLWDKIIAVNLTAVFHLSSYAAENMAKNRTKGVIVNVGSIAASGNAGQTAYSAAKAGVKAMTRVWADELAPYGIRVACIEPGFTDTNITAKLDDSKKDHWKKRIPLRRFASAEEIADGVMFIIENEYFNGDCLPLNGGLRM